MLRKQRLTGKTALTALVLGIAAPALVACDDGPAEQVGETIDEGAEETGEAMEDAGDAMENQAEETTQ